MAEEKTIGSWDSASPSRVVFLVGQDTVSTRLCVESICRLANVAPIAVLVDSSKASMRGRFRNLRKNIRKEGISYILFRGLSAIRNYLDELGERSVCAPAETDALVRKAFPEETFSLHDLALRCGFEVVEAGNLNSEFAASTLRSLRPDIGIVLGTRVLKRSTFAIPRLGCINLHKGKVPEYRGMPPGFWELYDGSKSAGVTVHFVDDQVDTGDVLGTCDVAIHPQETPDSLQIKLDLAGAELLASVIGNIQKERPAASRQPSWPLKPRTKPTRLQRRELQRRLPHWRVPNEARQALKTLFYLFLFHSGIYRLVRWIHSWRSRAAILLYHRVNDYSDDVLTTNVKRFAEHVLVLSKYYRIVPTRTLVEYLVKKERIEPNTVAIHFDDCYRDVYTCAAPILRSKSIPAAAFIASGYVDTARAFDHDSSRYPHKFKNLRGDEIRELGKDGFEIGSHTVNHSDLGVIDMDQARVEVFESRRELEKITESSVSLFSFPFGGLENIRDEVRAMARKANYAALFSAHGGFLNASTDPFDIPRLGVSGAHSPLCLLMDLEGLSLPQLKRLFRLGAKSKRGGQQEKPIKVSCSCVAE